METYNEIKQVSDKENLPKSKVHKILAHSYTLCFILFLIGVYLDSIFKFKIFSNSIMTPIGIILLVLASFLILWAQKTSRDLKTKNISKETFCQGPYCYTRSPTHWGLFFLMLGFGIIANALFVILFVLVAFIIAKFVFLNEQERILTEKYGTPYLEYKKQVKL
ncbi:MAG: methyltransferase [Patescibacteria group bacterium]